MTFKEIQRLLEGYPSGTKVKFAGEYGGIATDDEEAFVEIAGSTIFLHQDVWDNCFATSEYGKENVYSISGDYMAKNITSLRVVEEKLEEEKVVVAVPTQKEWHRLADLYERKGWKFFSGKSLKDTNEWSRYEKDLCIEFEDGCAYGARDTFESRGCTIISVDEAEEKLRGARSKCYISTCIFDHEILSPYPPHPEACSDLAGVRIAFTKDALMPQSHVFHNPKNIMSKITRFVKDLKLSQKDRLLRKHGLQDECGEPTHDYREILRLRDEAEGYDYVVSVAQQMEDEEKKEKKKK